MCKTEHSAILLEQLTVGFVNVLARTSWKCMVHSCKTDESIILRQQLNCRVCKSACLHELEMHGSLMNNSALCYTAGTTDCRVCKSACMHKLKIHDSLMQS